MNVTEIIALITSLGPIALQTFLALESRLNLTSDEKTNIANAVASANSSDQDTINRVTAWMTANGFVVQFVPKA